MRSAFTEPGTSELIDVIQVAGGWLLSFDRCLAANPVLRERGPELLRGMAQILRGKTAVRPESKHAALEVADRSVLDQLLPAIRVRVDSLAQRPCTPQMVDALLGIRSLERIRWTQDGRLCAIGSVRVRGDSGALCPVYRATEIAALASRPDIIATWRYQDARDRTRWQERALEC